jgi:hypothetical protein
MTASARSGKKTGPGSPRMTAITSAKARMKISATRKILTFRRNALGIVCSDSRKNSRLKNCCLTSGQPGELETRRTMTTANTIVLASAMSVLRDDPEAPCGLKRCYLRIGGAEPSIHFCAN